MVNSMLCDIISVVGIFFPRFFSQFWLHEKTVEIHNVAGIFLQNGGSVAWVVLQGDDNRRFHGFLSEISLTRGKNRHDGDVPFSCTFLVPESWGDLLI